MSKSGQLSLPLLRSIQEEDPVLGEVVQDKALVVLLHGSEKISVKG